VSFVAIKLCVASQRVFVVCFVMDSARKLLNIPLHWEDSLGRGSTHRKACIYTEQHNTGKRGHASVSRQGFVPTILAVSGSRPYAH